MYGSSSVSAASRVQSTRPPGAVAAGPTAPMGMAESAEILSRMALSRNNGVLTHSELLAMATNQDGDYAAPVQKAAQNLFNNRSAVHEAYDRTRRRNSQSRTFGGVARGYSCTDLERMAPVLAERDNSFPPQPDWGVQPQPQHHFGPQGGEAAYQQSLRDMAGYMGRRKRSSLSLDSVMFMDRQGSQSAANLLDYLPFVENLFARSVANEMHLMMSKLEEMLDGDGVGAELLAVAQKTKADAAAARADQASRPASPGSPDPMATPTQRAASPASTATLFDDARDVDPVDYSSAENARRMALSQQAVTADVLRYQRNDRQLDQQQLRVAEQKRTDDLRAAQRLDDARRADILRDDILSDDILHQQRDADQRLQEEQKAQDAK